MKKYSIIIGFLFIGCLNSSAQLLWKITGNGLKHPSYLFGSHHLIPISFLDSVPGLYKAYNNCDVVIGEMVLNNIDATDKIQQAAIMPKGLKINDLLSKEEFLLADKEVKSVLNLSLNDVRIMYPELILNLYKTEIYKKLTGLKDEMLSDSYFQMVAVEMDKKVIGLETIEQQISYLFQSSSPARQAELLIQTINEKASTVSDMLQLNKLYKEGKINDLSLLARKEGRFTDDEYSKIVDNRTENWAVQLPEYIKQSPCFITVGTMHLPGKNGLIKKLQNAGYKVKVVVD
jgi:uncharacterized protein YbaP (TraB family)